MDSHRLVLLRKNLRKSSSERNRSLFSQVATILEEQHKEIDMLRKQLKEGPIK